MRVCEDLFSPPFSSLFSSRRARSREGGGPGTSTGSTVAEWALPPQGSPRPCRLHVRGLLVLRRVVHCSGPAPPAGRPGVGARAASHLRPWLPRVRVARHRRGSDPTLLAGVPRAQEEAQPCFTTEGPSSSLLRRARLPPASLLASWPLLPSSPSPLPFTRRTLPFPSSAPRPRSRSPPSLSPPPLLLCGPGPPGVARGKENDETKGQRGAERKGEKTGPVLGVCDAVLRGRPRPPLR